jgi:hypothetical protein
MFFSQEEEEARQDEEGAAWGDARRCPVHPNVKTSSDDGMFDSAGCHLCEDEYDVYVNTESPSREFCGTLPEGIRVWRPTWPSAGCLDILRHDVHEADEIPF